MAVRTVAVGDPLAFEAAIAEHSARGFLLVNRTDTTALLRKPKQFNVLLAIQSEFDIEFPDQMLSRGVFESIQSISSAVSSLQQR